MLFAGAVSLGLELQVAIVQGGGKSLQLGVAVRLSFLKDSLLKAVERVVGIVALKYFNHFTFNAFKLLLQKHGKIHLAYEAYTLRVLLVGGRKVGFPGYCANFAL